MQTSASTTLDANVFATLSPGWLEALEGEDLQALELELEELVEKQSGIQAAEPYRAPFPKKSYFAPLFGAFRSESRLFIPKTREMLTSWCVMGDSAHRSQWMRWEVIVQTGSEDKAHELIDYAGQLYKNQPDWLRQLHPLDGPPSKSEVRWASGGRILAIPSGVNKIRLYHPTRYVMDEAAFLPEAEQCYNAANPVAQQIIAISSAGPGWFGDQCTR